MALDPKKEWNVARFSWKLSIKVISSWKWVVEPIFGGEEISALRSMILGERQCMYFFSLFWQEVVLSAEHDEFYQKVSFQLYVLVHAISSVNVLTVVFPCDLLTRTCTWILEKLVRILRHWWQNFSRMWRVTSDWNPLQIWRLVKQGKTKRFWVH